MRQMLLKKVAEVKVFVGEVANKVAEQVSEKLPQYADKVPEVAANQEEVEPIFNSIDLFGPEVEKQTFKINEVIAPYLNLGVAGSAEDFVLQVARELYEVNVPDEPIDDLESSFEKSMDVDMKYAGVHFGSSANEGLEPAKVDSLKGLCPFDDNIGKLTDMDLTEHFYNWLDAVLHVNVFFYYLRKLSKYGSSCEVKFTSTDCNFQKKLVFTCGLIAEYEDIESTFSANQDVLDVINGYGLPFRTPCDSGVIMISIAEYFVREKEFPKVSFDIACHRSRIAYSFYSYAIAKQINGYETEPEYLEDGDGHGPGKRPRGGMVQTRKRKIGKA
ncbi:hypothetical protein POM88_012749 [Heracleum sosnowskyi]|uniref:Uncharacterized protein n=1 Tax=Heracleum sosnowskyi TaxID=360622 RepID=A0AAD8N3P8_9APIA|nr:hypothetical protein POM88_012749 [Heracleum sosnowskyi]